MSVNVFLSASVKNDSMDTCYSVPVLWWGFHGAPGNWPPSELTATPKAKHINNKSNYRRHPTNLHSKHMEHSKGDKGYGKSKPTLSFPRMSQGLCYLPSNQYDSSTVLWMLLLAVGKALLITQKYSRDTCLLYHCIPIHLTFTSSICVDHFITACAVRHSPHWG